jgi:uncharacterized membrane protein
MSHDRSFFDRIRSQDITRAGLALVGLAALSLVAIPQVALATGAGVDLGLKAGIKGVRKFLTGPIATITATVAMIAVLAGIIMRSQRGESIGGLAAIGAALLLVLNVETILDLIGATAGSSMATAHSTTLADPSTVETAVSIGSVLPL